MGGRWLVLTLVVMAAACATDTGSQVAKKDQVLDDAVSEHNATAERENQIVCTRERVSGTIIARKICRTRSQVDQERQDAQETMDVIRRTVSTDSSGG